MLDVPQGNIHVPTKTQQKIQTSINSLQNAAKIMHGENTPLPMITRLYKPNLTNFSFTPFR